MLNTIILGVFGMGGTEIAVILVIVLLLFGGKKIPELMKGLGKGVREFKEGKEGTDEEVESNRTNTHKPL